MPSCLGHRSAAAPTRPTPGPSRFSPQLLPPFTCFVVLCRAMFLCSDQSLVRGDDARSWQLCDMFMTTINPTYAGPSQVNVLALLIKNGKQNKAGRTAQHRKVWQFGLCTCAGTCQLCTLCSAPASTHPFPIAAWSHGVCMGGAPQRSAGMRCGCRLPAPAVPLPLLRRGAPSDLGQCPLVRYPPVTPRSSTIWPHPPVRVCRYNIQLFFGSDPAKEMCYTSHLRAVNKVFLACKIKCSKKTHSARASGAQDTANAG